MSTERAPRFRLLVTDGFAPMAAARDPRGPNDRGWSWIDLSDPAPEQGRAACRALDIDPGAADLFRADAFPTARRLGHSVVIVTRSLSASDARVVTKPLVSIATPRGLLTVRCAELPGLEAVMERVQADGLLAEAGPGATLAALLDVGAQRFLPLTAALDTSIESLEEAALDAHPDVLQDTHALRRDSWVLRGVLRPQRDVIKTLSRMETPLFDAVTKRRLEDVYDLHQSIVEGLETARMLLNGVIEVYRSAVAERANDVMKVLTVFAATIMPLTLIAGVYGMNFANMPELNTRWAYPFVLGSMVLIAAGLWVYFVRRGFIGGPRRAGQVGRGLVSLAFMPVKTIGTLGKVVASAVLPEGKADDADTPDG